MKVNAFQMIKNEAMSIPPSGGGGWGSVLGDLDYVQSLVDCFFEGFPKSLHYVNGCYGTWDAKNGYFVTDKVQDGSCGIHIKQEVSFERKFVGSAFP